MVKISDISDKDKQIPLKKFKDGTEINFLIKEEDYHDFTIYDYQVGYSRGNKSIFLDNREILKYLKRLTVLNDVDIIINSIYRIYDGRFPNIRNVYSREDKLTEFINWMARSTDKIIDSDRIESIDCFIKEQINVKDIDRYNIIDKLYGELSFCWPKCAHYLSAIFHSDKLYVKGRDGDESYDGEIRMAEILYVLKENIDPINIFDQFNDINEDEMKKLLNIIKKYDKRQTNIEDAWI